MPVADDFAFVSVGKLTVENGVDQTAIDCSLDLTKDKHGLAQALALKALVDASFSILTPKMFRPMHCLRCRVRTCAEPV